MTQCTEAMDPKEKWERLTNPQTIEDYGLALNERELEKIQEWRALLATLRSQNDGNDEFTADFLRIFLTNSNKYAERITYNILSSSGHNGSTSGHNR